LYSDGSFREAQTPLSTDARQAFLTAMERSHGRSLHRFLSRRMGTRRAEASDLVQEVYLRLLRLEDIDAIRNPQAYLYTIANHVLHQYTLKASQLAEITLLKDALQVREDAEETDPEAWLAMEQRFEALNTALRRHSPRAYATLILYRCEGIPLKEIAPRLGCSYTMVKRYLAQALVFCQRMLDEGESP
jgi:RNA polymerase sigma factor (sigma-70 family)